MRPSVLLLALFGGDMPPEFGGNVIRKFSKADLVSQVQRLVGR